MALALTDIINLDGSRLQDQAFIKACKRTLDKTGVLVIKDFLKPTVISLLQQEGKDNQHLAYYTSNKHNVYLTESDVNYSDSHPRNRQVVSSKGCITTDQIPVNSALHSLYQAAEFRDFLCEVLGEQALYEYTDPLSSINLHYAGEGQELGWHYDNSSFAITLMVQSPKEGGIFEYVKDVKDVRDADNGDMNYSMSGKILDGVIDTESLPMADGALVLFRGRNSIHRVTPTVGEQTRMLVVLAYNTQPNISLSESARMTFFGRLD
ncbi:2OG-Fe(II) oxygenase [Psychromonas sp. GE-S-Ul-11]|uniref:HalD/BesD family halogenase n=1 Tax=Psychromonas sp. GE-S-Ul-11 TaxID=3241170 RepID=UPI00390CC833